MRLRMLIPVACLGLGGCASIVTGHNQSLSVETSGAAGAVQGAKCKLTNNKGTWFVTTPGTSVVQRSYEDLAVQCEHEGHEPGLSTVKSTTKGMAFGNIIFGGLIGAGIDVSTGAAYDYPSLIQVKLGAVRMGPDGKPIAPAAPAVVPAEAGAVIGRRLTLVEFEPVSGVPSGEKSYTVTAVRALEIELDDGAIVIQKDSGKVVRGGIGMATITGAPLNAEAGHRAEATFVPGGVGNAPVPVTLVSAGAETLVRGDVSLKVLRFQVSGYSTNDVVPGTPASHRGAAMSGTVSIDVSTGLVVAGDIKCMNTNYALKRELQRIGGPRTVAMQ